MASHSVAELGALGGARISVGSALSRLTHKVILEAGAAMLGGDLTPLMAAPKGESVDAYLI